MTAKDITRIWLRAETKPNEQRSALTPAAAQTLIESGYVVTVERSEDRIFDDDEFAQRGCDLVAAGSWRHAPADAAILGLKELPDEDTPLTHTHVYFGHAFKGQSTAAKLLNRFREGGGTLYDLEFLTDENGRRVSAFGYWAGYVGAALGLLTWAHQHARPKDGPLRNVETYRKKEDMLAAVTGALSAIDYKPATIIFGAKGRCGRGATELAESCDVELAGWDRVRTRGGGPFEEVLGYDVLVNCVLVAQDTPVILNDETIGQKRDLSVIADVSCDPVSPHNPIRLAGYETSTTVENPVLRLRESPHLDITAIDHLPSLLPKESSDSYCEGLLPTLLTLGDEGPPWQRARKVFEEALIAGRD